MTILATVPTTRPAVPGKVCGTEPVFEVAFPIARTIQRGDLFRGTLAECANCAAEVTVTIDHDGTAFTWYHPATGRERCDDTRR